MLCDKPLWNLSKANSLQTHKNRFRHAGVRIIKFQNALKCIYYKETSDKVWFKKVPDLFEFWFRQILLYFIKAKVNNFFGRFSLVPPFRWPGKGWGLLPIVIAISNKSNIIRKKALPSYFFLALKHPHHRFFLGG